MRTAAVLVMLTPLAGCGAIFNGTRQTISTTTSPDQVQVTVDKSQEKYTTPTMISLERKNDYTLTFTKAGYTPGTFHISHSIKGGILVLDILTGLVGVVVDAATGAWYSLQPSNVQVTLTKTDVGVVGPDSIRVGITTRRSTVQLQSTTPGVTVRVEKH
jgi:hypothetical protein